MVSIVIFVFQTTPDNLVGGSLQRQILQLSPWAHAGFEPAIHSDQTMRVTSYTNGPYLRCLVQITCHLMRKWLV